MPYYSRRLCPPSLKRIYHNRTVYRRQQQQCACACQYRSVNVFRQGIPDISGRKASRRHSHRQMVPPLHSPYNVCTDGGKAEIKCRPHETDRHKRQNCGGGFLDHSQIRFSRPRTSVMVARRQQRRRHHTRITRKSPICPSPRYPESKGEEFLHRL